MADKKKPKDPWLEPDKTVDSRREDANKIIAAARHYDYELLAKVGKALADDEGRPDYTLIDRTHKNYSRKKEDEVRKIINEHYVLKDKKIHPSGLSDAVKKEISNNYFTNQFFEHLYFPHKQQLLEQLGSSDFDKIIERASQSNANRLMRELQESAVADIDPEKHGHLVDYILKKAKADKKKLDVNQLRRNIKNPILSYMFNKEIHAEDLYQMAPLYKNETKKKAT